MYVSVTDTGVGIPEEKIPLVFEKFRQVDSSSTRAAEGTGLGMPISRNLIELHGGKIWINSQVGVGTTFTFYLPVAGPLAEEIPELAGLVIEKTKKMVLVIERSEEEFSTYRRFLDSAGYQLVGLYDPKEALRWARHLNPFVILMDVQLEGDQGWELLDTLRAARHTRQIPVVVCSRSDEGAQAISRGASAMLRKPLSARDTLEILKRLAGR